MNKHIVFTTIAAVLFGATAIMGNAFARKVCDDGTYPPCNGGGEPEPTQGNNLSFPAIAVDGYTISAITAEQFTVAYDGDYPGLTEDEISVLEASGPWYPQKTEGNTWQADNESAVAEEVSFVDWGDNIESVNPMVGRPFRLEVVLFKQLNEWADFDPEINGMTGYVMAELEYPSSSNELQGTNSTGDTDRPTYQSNFATVVSNEPKLVIQYYGTNGVPEDDVEWQGTQWSPGIVTPISFAVELNVGGKLIYGASEGGWKPLDKGWYRITFYSPSGSGVSLATAEIGNYADFSNSPADPAPITAEADEGGAATPVVVGDLNLSYVDVEVVAGGGGGGGGGGGQGGKPAGGAGGRGGGNPNL